MPKTKGKSLSNNRHDPLVSDEEKTNTEIADYIPKAIWKRFADAFHRSQKTRLSHKKGIQVLESLYSEMEEDEFIKTFLVFIRHLLVAPKAMEAKINLAMEMLTKFLNEHPTLAVLLIENILHFHRAADPNVRLRVCTLVHTIFDKIPDTDVDGSIYQRITDALQERCRDKIKGVRAIAVAAMHRLQTEDNVVKEFIRILESDSSDEVRSAAIREIRFCDITHDAIFQRLNDCHPKVRRAIYQRLAKISLRKIPHDFVQQAIEKGLTDVHPQVVEACENLLRAWLKRRDDIIPNFIKYFHSTKNRMLCENIIITLLDKLVEEKTFDNSNLWKCINREKYSAYVEELNSNSDSISNSNAGFIHHHYALYWRICLDYFTKKNQEGDYTVDAEEFQYGTLKDFLELLPIYQSHPSYIQVARELILMIKHYDSADPDILENAVRNISSALTFIFGDGAELVSEYVEALEYTIPDEDSLRDSLISIINSIREKAFDFSPEKLKPLLKHEKAQYNHLKQEYKEKKAHAIKRKKEFDSQGIPHDSSFLKLTNRIRELIAQRNDCKLRIQKYQDQLSDYPHLMTRIATILTSYLQNPKHRDQVLHLTSLIDNLIIPEILNEENAILYRPHFITILSQMATLDVEIAKKYFPLFVTNLQKELNVNCCNAWQKGIADIINTHGFSTLEIDTKYENNIIRMILWFASPCCSEFDLRITASQVLLQMCLRDRPSEYNKNIILVQIISLTHLYLNDPFYQHMLRSFFKSYSTKEKCLENLIKIVIPAIRRASILTKDTIGRDKRTFFRELVIHLISSINPDALRNPLSAGLKGKYLYSKLLLAMLFEIEVSMDKYNSGVILSTVFSLLQYCQMETSKDNHIYEYILHEISRLVSISRDTKTQATLKNLRREIIETLEVYLAPHPDIENYIEGICSLPSKNQILFEKVRNLYIKNGKAFYEELERHSVPLQQHSLLLLKEESEETSFIQDNYPELSLFMFVLEGTTDSTDFDQSEEAIDKMEVEMIE